MLKFLLKQGNHQPDIKFIKVLYTKMTNKIKLKTTNFNLQKNQSLEKQTLFRTLLFENNRNENKRTTNPYYVSGTGPCNDFFATADKI